jgi:transposase
MERKYSTYDVRLRAVRAVKDGMSISDVAKAYQTDRTTVFRWYKRFKADSESGLVRRTGSGRPRILEQLDADKLTEIVLSSALDFGYESDLWTCSRIQETIRTEFSEKVSRWTVWRRLREAKLTYQKPERRYIEASEEDRKHWRRHMVPKIRRIVKKKRAILYFQDESNISLTAFLGKTWAPSGKTPVQKVTGKRGAVSAMSAICGIGQLIFKLHKKRIASDQVINFLAQMLRHHPRRHLVVVMDQAPPHTSKKTKEYIESKKRLHVFYLPKYSPDWNPDEKLWNHLKQQELKGHRAKTKEDLKKLANQKLRKLARSPRKLRGIFFRCCVADLLH